FIDLDQTLVRLDANRVESEIVGVGFATGGDEKIRADDFPTAADRHHNSIAATGNTLDFCLDVKFDSFSLENRLQRRCNIGIFRAGDLRQRLDDHHFAAHSPVELRHLQCDDAAADHHDPS